MGARRTGWMLVGSVCVAAACGGQAIVDESAGGSGGTGTGSGTVTTGVPTGSTTGTMTGVPTGVPPGAPTGVPTGTTTGVPTGTTTGTTGCMQLQGDFLAAFQDAIHCNACMNYDSCINGPRIHDSCGCLVGASDMNPSLAAAAETAYETWVSAGCGPWDCGEPCYPPETPYYCTPTGSGCAGQCAPGWLGGD